MTQAAPAPATRATGFPPFRLLETLSFVNSAVFAGLLFFWLGPSNPSATMVLGWMHGLMWIALDSVLAGRARGRDRRDRAVRRNGRFCGGEPQA